MRRFGTVLFVGIGALALVVAIGIALFTGAGPLPDPEGCQAKVNGREVTLTPEQAENAALIVAISVQRGLPARAASIALATAYQESKIYNIEHGDRDSIGLFQQRPSQGWGTVEQILDPVYSINRFYDALLEVEDYQTLEITVAAQEVQRSAYPDAYADHEADARVLASALTGETPRGAFTCTLDPDAAEQGDRLNERGLTGRAEQVRLELGVAFGELALGGFQPAGVSDGHMEGSAHYDGRAIDVFVRPISPDNKRRGWAIAQYLVAQADRLAIEHVIFDDRIWSAGPRSATGWRDFDPPSTSGDAGTRAILEHRDHVHVDVFD